MKTKQTFTVFDVIEAECNLEPLVCIFCGSGEVTFHQGVGDASCSDCGEWQYDPTGDKWFSERELT